MLNCHPGVHIWLNIQTAMASDMSLMPLGIVSISTDPPLMNETNSNFRQTLYLKNRGAIQYT